MKQIRYSYCLDENNELVHIGCVTVESRHSHVYRCVACGQEMVANLGTRRKWHFSHKAETACDGESYLHKLAKRRIREKFIYSDSFPITFKRDVPCQEAYNCRFSDYYCCEKNVSIPRDLKLWKGKVVYDSCQEEISVDLFRPDLLLTGPTEALGPVFIEIYKTHASEVHKITSDFKIIETKKLMSEADIDDIINRGFVEEENCHTYNFSPKLPAIRKKDISITRFVLFENGAAKVYPAIDEIVTCDKLYQRIEPKSVRELNLAGSGMDIWGINEEEDSLNSYQTGLVYLVKKGMDIRNCMLCKFYKFNASYDKHICILYKTLGMQNRKPKQSMAKTCPRYEIDQNLLNHPLSELEKEVSEVPI